jgi:hypothetical protein
MLCLFLIIFNFLAKVIYLLFTREPLLNNLLARKYWQQGMAIYFTGPGMQKVVPQK